MSGQLLRRDLTGRPEVRYALRQLHGEQSPWTDAAPVRRHIAILTGWGLPLASIAAAAGVSGHCVGVHAHGDRPRIYRHYAAAILGVGYLPHPAQSLILAVGCRRRVQALVAQGYPMTWQAQQIGSPSKSTLQQILRTPTMRPTLRPAILALFNRLHATAGPSARAATAARRVGYVRSWAWDLDTIDDPDAVPVPCERTEPATIHVEDLDWLRTEAGLRRPADLAAYLKVPPDTVEAVLRRRAARVRSAATSKISDEQVRELRGRAAAGETPHALATAYSLSVSNVRNIIAGRSRAAAFNDPLADTG